MATYTSNLNLKKPNSEDFYNIADFNGNADILDTEVSKKVDKVSGGTEGNFAKLDANGGIADSGTNATNITNHMSTNITSSNGIHGLRYNDNKIQYYDNNTWNNAKTATHLYLSSWSVTGRYDSTPNTTYSGSFQLLTSYEPTATNLNTFKQMVGTNVGWLQIIRIVGGTTRCLTSVGVFNNKLKFITDSTDSDTTNHLFEESDTQTYVTVSKDGTTQIF